MKSPAWFTSARARYQTSRAFRWVVDLSVLALVLAVVGAFQTRNHPRGDAPAYVFTTLEGGTVSLASMQGKPTLVAVWAPWCGVCKAESGNVSRVYRWLGSRANVVSVATGYGQVAEVQNYMQAQGVDYPVLLARDDFQQVMRISAFPTVFVIDAQGRIVSSMQGYTTTFGLLFRTLFA